MGGGGGSKGEGEGKGDLFHPVTYHLTYACVCKNEPRVNEAIEHLCRLLYQVGAGVVFQLLL